MNELNFKYWLQGYAEICGDLPSKKQWEMIKEHAELAEKNGAAIWATEVTNPISPDGRFYCNPVGFPAGAISSEPEIMGNPNLDFRTPFNIDPSKIPSSC